MAIQAVSMSSTADEARRCAALQEQQRLQQQQIAAKAKAASAQPTSGHPTQRRVPEYDGESRALARQQATAAPTRPAARTAPAATAKPVATPPPSGHPSQRKAPVYDGESRGLAREQAALQQGRPLTTSHGAKEAREGVSKEAALAPFQLVSTRPPASIAAPTKHAMPQEQPRPQTHAAGDQTSPNTHRGCGGAGVTVGGSAAVGGGGVLTAGADGSLGLGIFERDGNRSLDGYASFGAIGLDGKTTSDYPANSEIGKGNADILGLSAGVGGGGFITNACDANELRGPFDTFTIGTPIGSVQVGKSGDTWIGSVTGGPGLPSLSISQYPTNTWSAGDLGSELKNKAVAVGEWAVDEIWDHIPIWPNR